MSVKLVVPLGMYEFAVTEASLTMLGPLSFNSSRKSVWSLETSLDPTEVTSIPEELGSESGILDSLPPTSSFS